jgi:hypothetical protein
MGRVVSHLKLGSQSGRVTFCYQGGIESLMAVGLIGYKENHSHNDITVKHMQRICQVKFKIWFDLFNGLMFIRQARLG